jgi:lysophospholipase L1-like esterase
VDYPRRSRTVFAFAVFFWTIACFASATQRPNASPALLTRTDPIRIMALGDSITAGVGPNGAHENDGGYRGTLARRLGEAGYRVSFVGTRTDFSDAIDDRAHEGWPGYVVRSYPSDPGPGQLLGPLTDKALTANDPDVILLMAGTNDLLRRERGEAGYTLPNIVQSVDLLLGEIVSAKPNAFVIVAPVVESPKIDACALRQFAGRTGCGDASASLKTLVDGYARRGYRVTLAAAMATAVPRDVEHFPDGIHPSGPGGYAAIADVWLHAIEDLSRPEQSSVAVDAAR